MIEHYTMTCEGKVKEDLYDVVCNGASFTIAFYPVSEWRWWQFWIEVYLPGLYVGICCPWFYLGWDLA